MKTNGEKNKLGKEVLSRWKKKRFLVKDVKFSSSKNGPAILRNVFILSG
jgi:hypothetical protein